MDNRTKELIAIGASVTANCQPCLKYHIDKAHESGDNEQEISEAISVAMMVRKGAIAKMDQFASTVFGNMEVAVKDSEKGCGCS